MTRSSSRTHETKRMANEVYIIVHTARARVDNETSNNPDSEGITACIYIYIADN